jgi:peptide chain release factor subunit 1
MTYKLKKLLKQLDAIRGRHTELVSVYIPAGYSLHEVVSQIEQEKGTAENIKSKQVRKNVTTALDKIARHLRLFKKAPANGLAIFCGNISEKEGGADIELWSIEPPEPLKTRLYWCDQKFDLEPLKAMIEEKQVYGIVCLDKSEADIGILRGKKIEVVTHFDSIVPGKQRAGGQSAQRFARVREGLLNDFLKQVGSAINTTFLGKKDILGILVGGPGPIKELLLKEDHIDNNVKKKILGTVDTGTTGEPGLYETVARGEHFLKEAEVIKEKKLLERFFEHLEKGQLISYGLKETVKAIELGAAEIILATEDAPYEEIEYICDCGSGKDFIPLGKDHKCEKCGKSKIIGRMDIIEALEEKAKEFSSSFVMVSKDTREGQQFAELGGIGAILRYEVE